LQGDEMAVQILCDLHDDDGAAQSATAPRCSPMQNMKVETMAIKN
jgi:hypothetical protein